MGKDTRVHVLLLTSIHGLKKYTIQYSFFTNKYKAFRKFSCAV